MTEPIHVLSLIIFQLSPRTIWHTVSGYKKLYTAVYHAAPAIAATEDSEIMCL